MVSTTGVFMFCIAAFFIGITLSGIAFVPEKFTWASEKWNVFAWLFFIAMTICFEIGDKQ